MGSGRYHPPGFHKEILCRHSICGFRCEGLLGALRAGRPSKADVDAVRSPFAATMLESLPCGRPLPMHKLFPTARCPRRRRALQRRGRAACLCPGRPAGAPLQPARRRARMHHVAALPARPGEAPAMVVINPGGYD